jgi:hypothetical protein
MHILCWSTGVLEYVLTSIGLPVVSITGNELNLLFLTPSVRMLHMVPQSIYDTSIILSYDSVEWESWTVNGMRDWRLAAKSHFYIIESRGLNIELPFTGFTEPEVSTVSYLISFCDVVCIVDPFHSLCFNILRLSCAINTSIPGIFNEDECIQFISCQPHDRVELQSRVLLYSSCFRRTE